MMAMQLSEAARVLQGQLVGSDVAFRGVTTDSRKPAPGALFVALKGPNFDGHAYLETAREQGAVAAAVQQCSDASPLPQVEVGDTRLALGQLGEYWRQQFQLPVVAITGSNGKTTVRSMTAAILSCCGRTLSTEGNLNNDIGLPLTLARLGPEDRFAVLEMGANHHGEIDYLAGLAHPSIAVITNAGPAHLEGFGDLPGVARAKGEIYTRLAPGATAVINADDQFAPLWRELAAHCEIVEFGLEHDAAVTASWTGTATGSDLVLRTAQGDIELHLPLPGRHNVMNALAACAVAMAAGADLAAVKRGLESLAPVGGRFNIHTLPGEVTVINDTYNANPESLKAALDVLALAEGERWLVLGDMGELGDTGPELHAGAGERAREVGVTRLFTLGPLARHAAEAFGSTADSFEHMDDLVAALPSDMSGPLHILVKGSRSMRMERAVAALGVDGQQGGAH